MGLFNDKQESIFDFGIDETAKAYLLETARWGKFLAIISLVSAFLVMVLTFAAVAVGLGYTCCTEPLFDRKVV